MMKAVLLARVSSKEQEEGHSLVAQLDRLRSYCTRKNLEPIQEFTLVESSTRGERPEFQKMIAYIKKQSCKVALVCDKVDRLQRSFREVPILEQLRKSNKLVLHFVSENQILDSEANNSQIMAYQIFVMLAENYTNCISDNVKRSFEKKIKEGTILTYAPIGYLNTTINGVNTVIEDPVRGPKIKLLFERYATGTVSVNQLSRYATEIGLVTRRNQPISSSQLHLVLSNTFYSGKMKIKGKLYPHHYKKLISQDLFDLCTKIRTAKCTNVNKRKRKDLLLTNNVRCPYCGKTYSPYMAKQKYLSLSAPHNDMNCIHPHISAKEIIKQITDITNALQFHTSNQKNRTLKRLENKQTQAIIDKDIHLGRLNESLTAITTKKNRLTDLYLEQGISRIDYDKKQKELSSEQERIILEKESINDKIIQFYSNLIRIVKIADFSHFLFKSSNFRKKSLILRLISSNFFIEDKKTVISIRHPFESIVQRGYHQIWGG